MLQMYRGGTPQLSRRCLVNECCQEYRLPHFSHSNGNSRLVPEINNFNIIKNSSTFHSSFSKGILLWFSESMESLIKGKAIVLLILLI